MGRKILMLCLGGLLLLGPLGAAAESLAAPDFAVPNGHFYSQAAGNPSLGFVLSDDAQARFWSEFQRLGGVGVAGYPISHRFTWDGFNVQVTQKGALQWRPEVGKVYFVNVFDQLSSAGKDGWLQSSRATPSPLPASFDANKNWNQIVAARLSLLNENSAIKAAYHAVPDPLNLYGLPASHVVDNGNHFAMRLQRAVIQQWKVAVPWAAAGQATVANGGDVGKEGGLYPAEVLAPLPSDAAQKVPTFRGASRPVPTPAPAPQNDARQTALSAINRYRAMVGVPPLAFNDALMAAAAAHVNYYVLNYGDPDLAGTGLHREKTGKPGFTGVLFDNRAKAAGYREGIVDENIGIVANPQRTVDWFIGTIGHRVNLLHPSTVHLGYAIASRPPIDVFDFGVSEKRPTVALPAVYPANGQRDIPTSADVREAPEHLPGIARPLGYPITISFHIKDTVSFASYSLTDRSGNAVRLHSTQVNWLRTLALIPATPLKAGETYTVKVSGTVNSQPFSKTWSYTTR